MLRIPNHQRDRIVDHARSTAPEECCGLLLALPEGSSVTEAIPAANVADDRRRRYEIDPRTLIDIHRLCRADGRRVVGYYHSHPLSDARASARDLAAAWPGVIYLIVGLGSGVELRAWQLADSRLVEEPVQWEDLEPSA